MSPRTDLAALLDAAAPANVTVFAEEPINPPALPAFLVRPGSPYREPSQVPQCDERWTMEVLALVPVDTVKALDALDALITIGRDVVRGMAYASYRGVRSAPTLISIGGKPMRGAVVELDVEVPEG
jgi:hypothetical protein